MIRAIVIAAALLLAGLSAPAATLPARNITLEWDYPPDQMVPSLSFYVYHTTNVTMNLTNWPVLTNFAGITNRVAVSVVPGEHYFFVTASNFWGFAVQSVPSNIAGTPPVAYQSTNIVIKLLP